METKQKRTKVVVSVLAVVILALLPLSTRAGDLEPSAPPGSTMKTLGEVEPRTAISSLPYIITGSGSYYLSANAQATSSLFSGITIWADNVTLDLKGFSLIGEGTAGLHGVFIDGGYQNITIRNGTITNWGGNGVQGATAFRCRVEDLQVINNAGSGIHLPSIEQRVSNCVASGNGTWASSNVYGIHTGSGSTVTGNTAYDNGELASGWVYGIFAGGGCTVSGNMANNIGNSATGSFVYSIYAGMGCTVTGNTVFYNGFSATGTVYGIRAGIGSTVTGNTARDNGYLATGNVYGFYTYSGTTVTGNTAYMNGELAGGTVYGIHLGAYNLVDQNTAFNNGTGAGSATNMDLGVVGCVYGINVAP